MTIRFETKIACAGYGAIDVRGRSMLDGTQHRHDFWSMNAIAMGHRALNQEEVEVLDILCNVVVIGDPRLWPYRVQRLVGAYGDPYLTTATGLAFYSGGSLGPPSVEKCMAQLQALRAAVGPTPSLDAVREWVEGQLEKHEIIAGYNVVARPTDERNDFVMPILREMGWTRRPWFELVALLDKAMAELKSIQPNAASMISAVFHEIGLTPRQGGLMTLSFMNWAVMANADEAVDDVYADLRRLPDEWVQWNGASPRRSPRAQRLD